MIPSKRNVVVLLHKQFLFIPSPFFNSANIITNCQYAAMSKPNLTINKGCPENKLVCEWWTLQSRWCTCVPSSLVLWIGTDAVHRHSNSVYTSCCVFMFKKVENPATCEMLSNLFLQPEDNETSWNSLSTLWRVWRTCHKQFSGTEMGATVQWRTWQCARWCAWLAVCCEWRFGACSWREG